MMIMKPNDNKIEVTDSSFSKVMVWLWKYNQSAILQNTLDNHY